MSVSSSALSIAIEQLSIQRPDEAPEAAMPAIGAASGVCIPCIYLSNQIDYMPGIARPKVPQSMNLCFFRSEKSSTLLN